MLIVLSTSPPILNSLFAIASITKLGDMLYLSIPKEITKRTHS
jgi:hypothetical protein